MWVKGTAFWANGEERVLIGSCLGPGAFTRPLIYSTLGLRYHYTPILQLRKWRLREDKADTEEREECESSISPNTLHFPWSRAPQQLPRSRITQHVVKTTQSWAPP